jgi:uncharacterized lipoprotein YajG
MNNLSKITVLFAATALLAGCASSRMCPTGQTAVSLVNGELHYEPVLVRCPVELVRYDLSLNWDDEVMGRAPMHRNR